MTYDDRRATSNAARLLEADAKCNPVPQGGGTTTPDTMPSMYGSSTNHVSVAIIGAGFGGIGLGARLARGSHADRGERDFRIFDRANGVGGTWWANRYPGCACDVPSHLYSLSFAPNPDWTRRFAPRAEIQAYLERCAAHFGVRPRLALGTGIEHARWDEQAAIWRLTDDHGKTWSADILISAIGGLSRPAWPQIPGLEQFRGPVFHSQQWDDSVELAGKRVAVIGTGASAAQFIPGIAERVAALDVYMRSPHWILPRPDAAIGPTRRNLYRRFPLLQKMARFGIWLISEARVPGLAWSNRLAGFHRWLARRHLRRQVPDAKLRAKLEPKYDIGCKRVILSSDFYPALMRENVSLIDCGIDRLEDDWIIDTHGNRRQVDVVILGTGFRATDPVPEGMITGRDGTDLGALWKQGPEAWRGVAVSGFPNLFLLMGPNTALGHNSVILMLEAQIEFVLRAIEYRRTSGQQVLEVKQGVQRDYNRWLHRKLAGTVWNSGGCSSWYLHPESGRNTTLWPGFTWQYIRMMRHFDGSSFEPSHGR
ncbi:MAG TPA: NAD(P)/FAD-dependent oxidoreductase [Wenzhouxiangellaceae bacterium]|nr:NAD(P)/FAD-dependent oxidoreductase [Wenzhouxiangellaceae bacterium]